MVEHLQGRERGGGGREREKTGREGGRKRERERGREKEREREREGGREEGTKHMKRLLTECLNRSV